MTRSRTGCIAQSSVAPGQSCRARRALRLGQAAGVARLSRGRDGRPDRLGRLHTA
ncbi:hypothetical protein [Paenirhodobacter enshiensis]|uniref:hypothetical protein n=1 Tax=Paenirhodobacter enshiensis TaxID=1105367 RepID=UPI0035AF55E5